MADSKDTDRPSKTSQQTANQDASVIKLKSTKKKSVVTVTTTELEIKNSDQDSLTRTPPTDQPPVLSSGMAPTPTSSMRTSLNTLVPEPKKSARQPPILCLGMARTGTASVGAGLNTLGVEHVHHGMKVVQDAWQWEILNRAADATFPVLSSYTGQPFTRDDWDELFGDYGAVTDMASFYAKSLIAAYPDAKVILVERDIDRWLGSVPLIFETWTRVIKGPLIVGLTRLAGSKSSLTIRKVAQGWTESENRRDILKNSRAAYKKHYEYIRATVPADQLLEYKLTDGWEPLAKFLGKPVPGPDVKFPHINEAAAFAQQKKEHIRRFSKAVVKNVLQPWHLKKVWDGKTE